jgi:DNA (cytosine-5)-methyltransferase 1
MFLKPLQLTKNKIHLIMKNNLFPYTWKLSEQDFPKDKGTVFSCFACGGGSTMGYKLAGFDVIGMNEIDPKMAACYIKNHNPKYPFIEPIQEFKDRKDLPKELYELDILDGSPPCSSFSTAGNRDKDWGKKKKFKEGQAVQVLDTLFFDFIDLAKELQPKIVISENVKGILLGKAKDYAQKILSSFEAAGYIAQEFVLDASTMGVPQRRERVFFIAIRKDLIKHLPGNISLLFNDFPLLNLVFNEKQIPFGKLQTLDTNRKELTASLKMRWDEADDYGMYDKRAEGGKKFGFFHKLMKWRVAATIMSGGCYAIEDSPHYVNKEELCKIGSYPLDYEFLDNDPQYLIGMSVPPIMIAQIATRIKEQWLNKIKSN